MAVARQAERDKQQGGRNKRLPRLNVDATKTIFNLFGADPNTTLARTINQKILSLSDHPPTQAVAQGGYTQVQCEPSAPLSPLSKKRGGYHRDVLLALAPKPLPTKQSRSDTRNVPPPPRKKPATPTESESKPELASKPKPKRTARQTEVGRAGARSTRAIAGPSTQRQQASPGPSTCHYDVQAIVDRFGDVLNGGEDEDGNKSDDQVLDQVIQLLLQRQQQACPSLSRHKQTEPSSSCPRHQSGSSTKRCTGCHATLGDEDPDQLSGSSSAQSGGESPVDLSRNGLARYPGKCGKVTSHAIPHLLAVAIRKGIFQSQDIYFKWARREYIRAWKKLYPEIKYKRPSRHFLRLMAIQILGFCMDAQKRVRPLMARLHRLRNP
ncbi:hypothetical protein FRC09_012248, partial [Ceratobasidium sp. 395]